MKQVMLRKAAFWIVWFSFVVYAFGFAPPNQPDTLQTIQSLTTGQIQGINPLIVALFNILGVFPVIYACVLLLDGRMQRVRAYPFVLGSFAAGAFALLPYLALREPNGEFSGPKDWLLKVLDSRWMGVGVTIAAVLLLMFGLTQGDWADFLTRWQTDRFVHVMSLDFCLLCILFPFVLKDDMQRRQWNQPGIFWAVSCVPFLGAAIYLLMRPPIAESPHSEPTPPISSSTNQ